MSPVLWTAAIIEELSLIAEPRRAGEAIQELARRNAVANGVGTATLVKHLLERMDESCRAQMSDEEFDYLGHALRGASGSISRARQRNVCIECLRDGGPVLALWQEAPLIALCPTHGSPLVDTCSRCQWPLNWCAGKVHECGRCQHDLRVDESDAAPEWRALHDCVILNCSPEQLGARRASEFGQSVSELTALRRRVLDVFAYATRDGRRGRGGRTRHSCLWTSWAEVGSKFDVDALLDQVTNVLEFRLMTGVKLSELSFPYTGWDYVDQRAAQLLSEVAPLHCAA
jgi:hypothetical protein